MDEEKLNTAEKIFWDEIPNEKRREEIADYIARDILERPYGQFDVPYLIPLARVFLKEKGGE